METLFDTDNIPEHIQFIFNNKDVMDLFDLARSKTSPTYVQHAKQLLNSVDSFSLDPGNNNRQGGSEINEVFYYIGPTLQQLKVVGSRFDTVLCSYLNLCPNLKELQLHSVDMPDSNHPQNSAIDFKNLRKLTLIRCILSDDQLTKIFSTCTDNLKAICLDEIGMDIFDLTTAPNSVRSLSYRGSHMAPIFWYINHNKNLETLKLKDFDRLDLTNISDNLTNMHTLHIVGERITHFEALAQCKHLKILRTDIDPTHETFERYPNSITGDNNICLAELQLHLLKVDMTLEMANSFRHFINLETVKLYIEQSELTNTDRFLETLANLPKLRRVEFSGNAVFNLNSIRDHLTQIMTLGVHVDDRNSQTISALSSMANLKGVQIHINVTHLVNSFAALVNTTIFTVAKSPSIQRLGLTSVITTNQLLKETLKVLNTSALKHIDLYSVLDGTQAIEVVRNTPKLKTFTQKKTGLYTLVDRQILRSIRPAEQLKIILDSSKSYVLPNDYESYIHDIL